MTVEPHAKIINAVAKKYLAPQGFFQKGRLRTWLQDNGWFLTVVEFQPSGFSKGTFLNVGMHFLWKIPCGEPVISFDYGQGRLTPPKVPSQYIAYHGDDDAFAQQLETMVRAAVKIAQEYQHCIDLAYAQRLICSGKTTDAGWREYDRAMLCFLSGDVTAGTRHMKHFINAVDLQTGNWAADAVRHCETEILPRCTTRKEARQMVTDMIQETRERYRKHPAFQPMSQEPYAAEDQIRSGFLNRIISRWSHDV